MGHVAITTHPHPSNDSAGYKSQLEWHPAYRYESSTKTLASIKAYHQPMAESLVVSNCHSDGLLVAGPAVCVPNLPKCDSLARIFENLPLQLLELEKSLTWHPITPPT